ncbi:hypothetical protein ACPF8X_33755 [Streptomyces sp. G35A]
MTGLCVAGLAGAFAVIRWDDANRLATVLSVLVSVSSLGVAVWAALPGARASGPVQVEQTGDAVADGGTVNTGLTGPATDVAKLGPVRVERTGRGRTRNGGDSNTGVHLT